VEKLLNERDNKNNELLRVKSTTIQEMWLQELTALENEYNDYRLERMQSQNEDIQNKKTTNKKTKSSKKKFDTIQLE
jgi:hypothetical protein